ncbi:putative porin [Gelidibacter japonicus]|uniref:putative porin n=1 Tax=Gelidibacter japonicus TaxID=1962232 RepID=UPI0020212B0D|nr:putative porin [Gelidibacter japonicus]MCL8008969.1 putative porin [Gelidibacter japonicus]
MYIRIFSILVFFLFTVSLSAQTNLNNANRPNKQGDSALDNTSKPKNKVAKVEDYLIIGFDRDTTYLDTTLSIKKEYKFNYLRKDEFGLIPFSNIGQTYNSLTHDYKNKRSLPLFGARAKHFNYMEKEDINYFHVPTPLTELFYKTAFQQGQLVDAFFTVNMSKQFNFSIAYKGLRSLGKYQHILTSTGNFRFTSSYNTKNDKYQARAHIVMQDILNQENGGLTDNDIEIFKSGDQEFINRAVFSPNFEDAESMLEGKRFFLDHQYNLLKPSDSLSNKLSLGQVISFEDKYYQFRQDNQSDFFGEAFLNTTLGDKVTLEDFSNRFFVNYKNDILGELQFSADFNNYNYGYDAITVIDGTRIPNRLKGSVFGIGGAYKNKIGGFNLDGEFGLNLSGDFNGNFLDLNASYKLNSDIQVLARLNSNSKRPNFNLMLYQSDYINYNWDNSSSFKNIQTQNLAFKLRSNRIASAEIEYTTINNHAYFTKDLNNNVKPAQAENTLNYLKLNVSKEFHFGKFALDNTIMYQNVVDGEGILNVPQIITRNTIYFSDHLFKKALFLQTGITLNYFTEYKMDAYDPLLGEFYTQNLTEVGNFPRLDFFINAKVRQTRIYFKAEHFNSAFTGYNYFSAPNNPYRDFSIRFGIVWNFFL